MTTSPWIGVVILVFIVAHICIGLLCAWARYEENQRLEDGGER